MDTVRLFTLQHVSPYLRSSFLGETVDPHRLLGIFRIGRYPIASPDDIGVVVDRPRSTRSLLCLSDFRIPIIPNKEEIICNAIFILPK